MLLAIYQNLKKTCYRLWGGSWAFFVMKQGQGRKLLDVGYVRLDPDDHILCDKVIIHF